MNKEVPEISPFPSDPGRKHGDEAYLGGRLPLLGVDSLSDAQRELYTYLQQTKLNQFAKAGITGQLKDGSLIGPFNPFLYRPAVGRAFNGWMDAQSLTSLMTPEASQVVILTIGAAWQSEFEIYAHAAAARAAGLSDNAIQALLAGQEPQDLSDNAKTAYRFTHELVTTRSVGEFTYKAAVQALTVEGVVDLVNLIAYYLATSVILNAFSIPAPPAADVAR